MPRLNEISGNPTSTLSEWITRQDYTIILPLQNKNEFILELSNPLTLISTFAFDCNRMASAAFESMYLINRNSQIPRATAWFIIQSYYAAFFAGHSILRILGVSCSQLEYQHIKKVNTIAQLYSTDNGIEISNGYYQCTYNPDSKQLICKNLKQSGGGSHESFWKIFHNEMKQLSNEILSSSQSVTQESQIVASQLDNMCTILCHENRNGGNWLSYIRNTVNYRHELGSWFPYRNRRRSFVDELYAGQSAWLAEPLDIELVRLPGTDLRLFQRTCTFIVSLCKVLIEDMAMRCPTGKSFLEDGSIRLLNTMAQGSVAS
jgi:hypothetical protein